MKKVWASRTPTALGFLRHLTAKGFIRTETGVADRRVRNVFLTKTDPAFWEAIETIRLKAEKSLSAGLSKDEVASLKFLLKKILDNIR